MKTIKRSLAGCLAFLLAVLSPVSFMFVPAPVVLAEETNTVFSTAKEFFSGLAAGSTNMAAFLMAEYGSIKSGSYSQIVKNIADFLENTDTLFSGGHIFMNASGEAVIDETAQNTIKEKVQSEMANVEGWWWLRGNMSARNLCAGYANEYGLGPSFLSNADRLFVYVDWGFSSRYYYHLNSTSVYEPGVYLVGSNVSSGNYNAIRAYNESCESASLVNYSSFSYALNGLSGISVPSPGTYSFWYMMKENISVEHEDGTYYIGQVPRRVFTSTSSLKLILSTGDISLIDTDPATEPVSISPDTLTKTDWQKVSEKQHNEIVEELGDIKDYLKGAVTQKEMNELIKKQTKKLNNAIENAAGDITDAIETEKNILEKILKQMKTLNSNVTDGFNNIAELIGNQGGTSVAFSSEEIVAAITQLQEALLSDNQEFNEQTAELIAKCSELLTAVEGGNECVSADLETIKELMQNIVNNTADPDSTINFKVKEIRDFLELMQVDVEELSEKLCKLDVDVLNDLLTKMLTGTDKQSELLEDILKETKKSNALLTASLLQDLFQDILDGDDSDNSLIDELGDAFTPVAMAAKGHFPFSVPWDIYALVSCLKAEPEVPVFDIPVKIENSEFSFDETLHIDLSDFKELAKGVRAFLKLLFLAGLVWMTWRMTHGGDDGGEDG